MKTIIVHSAAEMELWNAVEYYENKSPGLGLDLHHEISKTLNDIQETPKKGSIKKHGTRCRSLTRFPYSIYYLELKNDIWIVAITHKRRKPYYWSGRLQKG